MKTIYVKTICAGIIFATTVSGLFAQNYPANYPAPPIPASTLPTTSTDYLTRSELESILAERDRAAADKNFTSHQGIKKGKFTLTPYGYFNVSAAFNSQRMGVGDYALWALSPTTAGTGAEFYIDVKSTRLGVKFAAPPINCLGRVNPSGTVEIDFQQPAYVHRNRTGIMLRHAYFELQGKENRLLIGQTWDIVAPLVPGSIAYAPCSTINLGYRRPQIRFEKHRTHADGSGWVAQAALADNAVMDTTAAIASPALDVSGWPQLQGRVAKKFAGVTKDLPIIIGLSGHLGEYQFKAAPKRFVPTWSGILDVDLPITSKWRFQSELFMGECLSSLVGSALIGVDANQHAVRATGGWINSAYQCTKTDKFNLGYGIEDMGNAPIVRTRNQIFYTNWYHNWTESFLTVVELSYYETNWKESTTWTSIETGKSGRLETVFRYSF